MSMDGGIKSVLCWTFCHAHLMFVGVWGLIIIFFSWRGSGGGVGSVFFFFSVWVTPQCAAARSQSDDITVKNQVFGCRVAWLVIKYAPRRAWSRPYLSQYVLHNHNLSHNIIVIINLRIGKSCAKFLLILVKNPMHLNGLKGLFLKGPCPLRCRDFGHADLAHSYWSFRVLQAF